MTLLSLRLPFGGSPCFPEFCVTSDITILIINDLLASQNWDHKKVCSKFIDKIFPLEILNNSISFAQARELAVTILLEVNGKTDCFINDIITVAVDKGENLEPI